MQSLAQTLGCGSRDSDVFNPHELPVGSRGRWREAEDVQKESGVGSMLLENIYLAMRWNMNGVGKICQHGLSRCLLSALGKTVGVADPQRRWRE